MADHSESIPQPRWRIRRQDTLYDCKFGGFSGPGNWLSKPCGVAVDAQNNVLIVDMNNHRIQIFDKDGRFKSQFGKFGNSDGELMYPNRVAVAKASGNIIVTERPAANQVQIYNKEGEFVRKFGADVLKQPRGLAVDSDDNILVVDCLEKRLVTFDQSGSLVRNFDLSEHLIYPNGVAVNDRNEIFISDGRGHCVKVFNHSGQFLRQIGGRGSTNYPIGVGIYTSGQIVIAGNYRKLHLTVFTPDGRLVAALESLDRHGPCLDLALMNDASLVVTSRDHLLYIYRFVIVQSPQKVFPYTREKQTQTIQ